MYINHVASILSILPSTSCEIFPFQSSRDNFFPPSHIIYHYHLVKKKKEKKINRRTSVGSTTCVWLPKKKIGLSVSFHSLCEATADGSMNDELVTSRLLLFQSSYFPTRNSNFNLLSSSYRNILYFRYLLFHVSFLNLSLSSFLNSFLNSKKGGWGETEASFPFRSRRGIQRDKRVIFTEI